MAAASSVLIAADEVISNAVNHGGANVAVEVAGQVEAPDLGGGLVCLGVEVALARRVQRVCRHDEDEAGGVGTTALDVDPGKLAGAGSHRSHAQPHIGKSPFEVGGS